MLTITALGCTAPVVGMNSNYEIASAATQDNILAEKNEEILMHYDKYIVKILYNRIYELNKRDEIQSTPQESGLEQESELEYEVDNYIEYGTPMNNSFKAFMDYRTITDPYSEQAKLLVDAVTDTVTGIMAIDGRYCIAVGSYYTNIIGTKLDLVMENGEIIPCILTDCKADIHTDYLNQANPNGGIAEFVVNYDYLPDKVRLTGDVSNGLDMFKGEIERIRVYE